MPLFFLAPKKERAALRKSCQDNGLAIIIPNKTRWFAELLMIEVFLKIEKAVKLHAIDSEKMVPISATDWKNARGFCDILQPII